jgi:hypothetical protein
MFKPNELNSGGGSNSQPQANQKHNDQCREYSSDPPCVESGKAELPLLQILYQQGGDQKSRDDEKYIDTHIAARNQTRRGAKSDNKKDGDRTEPINIRPILRVCFFPANAYVATAIAKASIKPVYCLARDVRAQRELRANSIVSLMAASRRSL